MSRTVHRYSLQQPESLAVLGQHHSPYHKEEHCSQQRCNGDCNDPGCRDAQQEVAFYQLDTVYATQTASFLFPKQTLGGHLGLHVA